MVIIVAMHGTYFQFSFIKDLDQLQRYYIRESLKERERRRGRGERERERERERESLKKKDNYLGR